LALSHQADCCLPTVHCVSVCNAAAEALSHPYFSAAPPPTPAHRLPKPPLREDNPLQVRAADPRCGVTATNHKPCESCACQSALCMSGHRSKLNPRWCTRLFSVNVCAVPSCRVRQWHPAASGRHQALRGRPASAARQQQAHQQRLQHSAQQQPQQQHCMQQAQPALQGSSMVVHTCSWLNCPARTVRAFGSCLPVVWSGAMSVLQHAQFLGCGEWLLLRLACVAACGLCHSNPTPAPACLVPGLCKLCKHRNNHVTRAQIPQPHCTGTATTPSCRRSVHRIQPSPTAVVAWPAAYRRPCAGACAAAADPPVPPLLLPAAPCWPAEAVCAAAWMLLPQGLRGRI
jgi:hypothetical protein